jgi:8-oxo-dGTP pyrophosphatase MutT (NUDIX family)
MERLIAFSGIEAPDNVRERFLKRLDQGGLSMQENPRSHFCVFFAAYDPVRKQVFLGFHKRSGLWLANGGHIEIGESPWEAVRREVKEEWGEKILLPAEFGPQLLTISEIEKFGNDRKCKEHYDFWYFLPYDSEKFDPDPNLIEKEFFQADWYSFIDASYLVDKNTKLAIRLIQKLSLKK